MMMMIYMIVFLVVKVVLNIIKMIMIILIIIMKIIILMLISILKLKEKEVEVKKNILFIVRKCNMKLILKKYMVLEAIVKVFIDLIHLGTIIRKN